MGTEVLRPQDCLIQRIRVVPAAFNRRKSCYPNGNARFRKPVVRPEQKKRFNGQPETTTTISKRSSSPDDLRKNFNDNNNHALMMGKVTILRRGEALDSKIKADEPLKKSGDDLLFCGTERLGPDPEMLTKQIRIGDLKSAVSPAVSAGDRPDMYAGSAFSLSPSPRALPLPSFFNKKQVSKIVEDSATRDLRRLLRLD